MQTILIGILMLVTLLARVSAADLPFLHQLFTDHAVLQRDVKLPVWGWTVPGSAVTLSVDGGPAITTKALATGGRWQVMIGPFPAGGPHTLTITGAQQVTVKDVLFGDVWICSGQSNMEFGIGNVVNADAEIAAADNPRIRLFRAPNRIGIEPAQQVDAQWQECTKSTIATGGWKGFSAVGYFFGRELEKELHVPMGLVQTCWGGTLAEAWTSADTLGKLDDFKVPVHEFLDYAAGLKAGRFVFAKALEDMFFHLEPGTPAHWESPDLADTDWKTMTLPTYWQNAGYPDFKGAVWFRREVTLPVEWTKQDIALHLGVIADQDTTYVNGTPVGWREYWNQPRDYTVSAKLLKPGRNVIAVRVLDVNDKGGMFGKPEEMRLECPGQPPIPLAGAWRCKFSTPRNQFPNNIPQRPEESSNTVTGLYNGMIANLLPFAIKGAIWYQGESNVERALQYRQLLPALISDWRTHFNQGDFPFYIVQIANLSVPDNGTGDSNWACIREGQSLAAFHIPHCGLASAIDIGDANDIHPKNKQEVGRRLALNALAQTYGKNIEYQGPVLKDLKVEGATIRLSYTHIGGGLVSRTYEGTPQSELRGFAIAGEDKHYVVAQAHIDGDSIVLSAPEVPHPLTAHYDWGSNPPGTLYNKAGLPAIPFRSDSPK